jgi:carboxypeptidase C (cathepsin A)
MVYIDQPVTTGFSRGTILVDNEEDVANQFMGFWKNFINTFNMQGFKIYSMSNFFFLPSSIPFSIWTSIRARSE